MRQPENKDEVLALYHTTEGTRFAPSDYAFGPDIPIQSQYEINLYVRAIGKEHEAELAREAEQRAASGGS